MEKLQPKRMPAQSDGMSQAADPQRPSQSTRAMVPSGVSRDDACSNASASARVRRKVVVRSGSSGIGRMIAPTAVVVASP